MGEFTDGDTQFAPPLEQEEVTESKSRDDSMEGLGTIGASIVEIQDPNSKHHDETTSDNKELVGTGDQLHDYVEEWFNGLDDRDKHALETQADFGRILADRVGSGKVPEGYVLATELLLYDCQTGVDGFSGKPMPRSLVGYPPIIYTLLKMQTKDFARGAFGDDFANQVDEFYKQVSDSMKKKD